uniref:Pentatricopeptide repeat-containing protein n=1 Tax=Ananas comosus var. bracteatus TaxID=296719 RepID=A0A6V7Q4E8_ANACO|nr:unnamed protein product [Ananas comosus var. bracteatus]
MAATPSPSPPPPSPEEAELVAAVCYPPSSPPLPLSLPPPFHRLPRRLLPLPLQPLPAPPLLPPPLPPLRPLLRLPPLPPPPPPPSPPPPPLLRRPLPPPLLRPLDRRRLLHRHLLHPHSPPSRPLLDIAVSAYAALGLPHLAAQLFHSMRRRRLRPSLLTSNTLLAALARSPAAASSPAAPLAVYADMLALGVTPTTRTFNILAKVHCSRGRFADALALLPAMAGFGCSPTPSPSTPSSTGTAAADATRGPRPPRRHEGPRRPPNRATYNTLVAAYSRLGWLKEATRALDLMTTSGFVPDVWTYNVFVAGLCREGRIEEAFRMKGEMEKLEGLPINSSAYITLMDGFIKRQKRMTKGPG